MAFVIWVGAAAVWFAAALVLLHQYRTYLLELEQIEQDLAWHVMWHEPIAGEWRSDADASE